VGCERDQAVVDELGCPPDVGADFSVGFGRWACAVEVSAHGVALDAPESDQGAARDLRLWVVWGHSDAVGDQLDGDVARDRTGDPQFSGVAHIPHHVLWNALTTDD
jgi:hypothetical protein